MHVSHVWKAARRFSCVLVALCALGTVAAAEDFQFRVTFSDEVRTRPYSGRVYLLFSLRDEPEPRLAQDWFHPEPILAREVENWTGTDPLEFDSGDPDLLRFPRDWGAVSLSGRRVQAVARFNPWERNVGTGAGNGYSRPVTLNEPEQIELEIDHLVAERPFEETDWSKEFCVRSRLLSQFYGRDVVLRAAVNLPKSYRTDQQKRYPVVFNIPGFGGTHRHGRRTSPTPCTNRHGVEFIEVVLDPSCPLGHHAFADSDNNGPWGTALVSEFLPALDAAWRTDPRPQARFLTGHSSGGWSSLWLQITHPEVFGGTWSTAPDPVDFRDFQQINIYRDDENMFVDATGKRRPLARLGGRVALWYDSFSQMEEVLGYGGQLHSFEAVFSRPVQQRRNVSQLSILDAPRLPLPQPALLWDRSSGAIDPSVARQWERYDIRLKLEEDWSELGPKLSGKLHVFMGSEDTFYLEGATMRLKESLAKLGSDAVVEIAPGRNHFDLLSRSLLQRIEAEMAESYVEHLPDVH